MKTYCKPKEVDVENAKQNLPAVRKCFRRKLKRNDFQLVLINTGKITRSEIALARLNGDMKQVETAKEAVCEEITQRIRERNLRLKPIREFQRIDGLTHKVRDICQETPEQQIMEYIAVEALQPLFRAKLLDCQFGSIPGRGQVSGKRRIERLLRRKCKDIDCVVKCDASKAYPSITTECAMTLLQRDIGKNKVLIWFLRALMINYPGGHLCIGGYLPAWLFNYVMSYVLRHLMSQASVRRGVRKRMIRAIVCFADDFAVFGHFSSIRRAIAMTTRWSKQVLNLNIKPVWKIYWLSTFEQEKYVKCLRDSGSRRRTTGVDMMGFVVYRTYTIIRGRIFRRIRRQIIRATNDLARLGYIPWWRACRLTAYKGWLKHSSSQRFAEKYNLKTLMKLAARSVSRYGRKEIIRNERDLLIIIAAGG